MASPIPLNNDPAPLPRPNHQPQQLPKMYQTPQQIADHKKLTDAYLEELGAPIKKFLEYEEEEADDAQTRP